MQPIQITHDLTLDLAVGRTRRELQWKNQSWRWSDLVKKLSTTHRTAETHLEYISAKPERQSEIKDIGGFVGGFLNSGRRKSGNVVHRQLISLDIDFSKNDFWDLYTIIYGNAAVIYSTHKHSIEKPRFRLLVPLDREVAPDEYEAIARSVAGKIGIELFDPTTFQPERLMYWPSTSKDGTYLFEYQDGPPLNADKVLASYHDWTDTSSWPVSVRVGARVLRDIKKQGDPLDKTGLIGAFCRQYTIAEAIDKYLPDVYKPCEIENRFTYVDGSTSGGLIVYDNKYAFSHHGTDPTSGKLCNAFDLVRLHLFGLKDEDAKAATVSNKLPSFKEMSDFVMKDKDVVKLLGAERLASAVEDFKDFSFEDIDDADLNSIDVAEEINEDWLGDLAMDKNGKCFSTIGNICKILENDHRLKGRFFTDAFQNRKIVRKNLPWRKVSAETMYVTDIDEQNLMKYLEHMYGIQSKINTGIAFETHIDANSFHPVKDYLNKLKWDGTQRLDRLFIDYLGCEETPYVRAVTRKTLTAAVARIFRPGVKFDYILTFIGTEGIGKSSIISKLGGAWFSDSFSFNLLKNNINKAYEALIGTWIVEIAELSGMRKTEVETIKHFISKQEDTFRWVFGKNLTTFKRQNIFIGSTNNRDFLNGSTGNRRFWPLDTHVITPVKSVFKEFNAEDVNQIWAEAMVRYAENETLYLPRELELAALELQKEHTEKDDRLGLVERYLETLLPATWESMNGRERRNWMRGGEDEDIRERGSVRRDRVCIPEIWCEALGGQEKEMNTQNTKAVHNILRMLDNWREEEVRSNHKVYGKQKHYERVNKSAKSSPFLGEKNWTTR